MRNVFFIYQPYGINNHCSHIVDLNVAKNIYIQVIRLFKLKQAMRCLINQHGDVWLKEFVKKWGHAY